jgi:hypothetical protein
MTNGYPGTPLPEEPGLLSAPVPAFVMVDAAIAAVDEVCSGRRLVGRGEGR